MAQMFDSGKSVADSPGGDGKEEKKIPQPQPPGPVFQLPSMMSSYFTNKPNMEDPLDRFLFQGIAERFSEFSKKYTIIERPQYPSSSSFTSTPPQRPTVPILPSFQTPVRPTQQPPPPSPVSLSSTPQPQPSIYQPPQPQPSLFDSPIRQQQTQQQLSQLASSSLARPQSAPTPPSDAPLFFRFRPGSGVEKLYRFVRQLSSDCRWQTNVWRPELINEERCIERLDDYYQNGQFPPKAAIQLVLERLIEPDHVSGPAAQVTQQLRNRYRDETRDPLQYISVWHHITRDDLYISFSKLCSLVIIDTRTLTTPMWPHQITSSIKRDLREEALLVYDRLVGDR